MNMGWHDRGEPNNSRVSPITLDQLRLFIGQNISDTHIISIPYLCQ